MTGRLAGWLFTMGNRKNKKKKSTKIKHTQMKVNSCWQKRTCQKL